MQNVVYLQKNMTMNEEEYIKALQDLDNSDIEDIRKAYHIFYYLYQLFG